MAEFYKHVHGTQMQKSFYNYKVPLHLAFKQKLISYQSVHPRNLDATYWNRARCDILRLNPNHSYQSKNLLHQLLWVWILYLYIYSFTSKKVWGWGIQSFTSAVHLPLRGRHLPAVAGLVINYFFSWSVMTPFSSLPPLAWFHYTVCCLKVNWREIC